MGRRSCVRMRARCCVLAILLGWVPSTAHADAVVAPGWDLLTTVPPTSFAGVPFTGVPLGSFDFGGTIGVKPTGMADTIVQRLAPANGPSETIPIELVALQLQSVVPADFGLGVGIYYVTLQSARGGPPSLGMQTIDFGAEGSPHGTFNSFFDIFVDLRFEALDGPIASSTNLPLMSTGTPWAHEDPNAFLIPGVNYQLKGDSTTNRDFFPLGVIQEQHGLGVHAVVTSGPPGILGVPEPSSLVLLGLGAASLAGYGWRKRRTASR